MHIILCAEQFLDLWLLRIKSWQQMWGIVTVISHYSCDLVLQGECFFSDILIKERKGLEVCLKCHLVSVQECPVLLYYTQNTHAWN